MISSIRLDGTTACMVVDGATDGAVFCEYIAQVLVPSLRAGDIVIADNLPAHRDGAISKMIEAVGAEYWLLPPYSPDLNPIEKMWSKVKQHLRSAEARTKEALFTSIGEALANVTPQDSDGWFRSCGYMTPH